LTFIDNPKKTDKLESLFLFHPFPSRGRGVKNLTSQEEKFIKKLWSSGTQDLKAKIFLGFEPKVSLSEGAKLTFEWYKKEKWLLPKQKEIPWIFLQSALKLRSMNLD
jgi:hypothetical protein